MTTSILFDRVSTDQDQIHNLSEDQLEMVSGGANETCRLAGNPRKGNYRLTCWQYKNQAQGSLTSPYQACEYRAPSRPLP
jgi:hypothetical protein